MNNRPHSEKTKRKISNTLMGHECSDSTKKKISESEKGKNLSTETKIKIGRSATIQLKRRWKDPIARQKLIDGITGSPRPSIQGLMPKNMQKPGKFQNIQRGHFDINGKSVFFRSKWEANYALYLDFLTKHGEIKKWTYEPVSFLFDKIKSGTRTYRPDFFILKNDGTNEYHEVKGWMDPKSITKLKRMKKYYPDVKIIVIDGNSYKDIKKKVGGMLHFY